MSAVLKPLAFTPFLCPQCMRGYVDAGECDWCANVQLQPQRVPLDMAQVTREAMGVRPWRLEYDSNGKPFYWTGEAANEAAADSLARYQLALDQPEFSSADARLVICTERSRG